MPPSEIDFRDASGSLTIRAAGTKVSISGHAAVFNQDADIAGLFLEQIMPGAFSRAIREDDVPLLLNHDGLPLARSTAGSGTLRLSEDRIGLRIDTELDAADPDVMRAVPKMKRGDLNKMSFAFRALREEWDERPDTPIRTLLELQLFDVSIVTRPAYEGTDVGLNSKTAAASRAAQSNASPRRPESRYQRSEIAMSFEHNGAIFNKLKASGRWEVLGALHRKDAHVFARWLAKRARKSGSGESAAHIKLRLQKDLLARLQSKTRSRR